MHQLVGYRDIFSSPPQVNDMLILGRDVNPKDPLMNFAGMLSNILVNQSFICLGSESIVESDDFARVGFPEEGQSGSCDLLF